MLKISINKKIKKLTNSLIAVCFITNLVAANLVITSLAVNKTVNAAVDTTAPILTKVFPFDDYHISGSKVFHIKATDSGVDDSGINDTTATMRLWDGVGINDSGVLPLTNGAPSQPDGYRTKYQTANLPDGSNYQVDFYVEDNAGNPSTTTVNNITLDNTSPTGSFTNPSNGNVVAGIVDIRGSGSDLNISGYNIIIRDSSKNIVRIALGSVGGNFVDMSLLSWNTFNLPNGDYRLDLHIKDKAGNGSNAKKGGRINLTVANVIPPTTSGGTTGGTTTGGTGTPTPTVGTTTTSSDTIAFTNTDLVYAARPVVDTTPKNDVGETSSAKTDDEGESLGETSKSPSWMAKNWSWLLALLTGLFIIFFWARRKDDDEEEI